MISKRGDHPWPPRSPDLTVCDFFLWGYMKQFIWTKPQNRLPSNLRELKIAITDAANHLDSNMIKRSFQGMVHRVRRCINVNGNNVPGD